MSAEALQATVMTVGGLTLVLSLVNSVGITIIVLRQRSLIQDNRDFREFFAWYKTVNQGGMIRLFELAPPDMGWLRPRERADAGTEADG